MYIHSILLFAIFAITSAGDKIVLVAVGDVMLSRGVDEKIREYGSDYPFADVVDVLQLGEIGFCNLECILTKQPRPKSTGFVFKADPILGNALAEAGFNLVSLANNHSLDCGVSGLKETIQVLTHAGISPILETPTTMEVGGLKVGALAFNLVNSSTSEDNIVDAVKDLRKDVDIAIISLHWGIEYRLSPSEKQRKLAHKIVDAGANLVLGHHSHRVQGIGSYRGGIIAYSLGNFVFDQRDSLGKDTIILLVELSRTGVKKVTVVPAIITDFRPGKASHKTAERILARLIRSSAELNTHAFKTEDKGVTAGKIYLFRDETNW